MPERKENKISFTENFYWEKMQLLVFLLCYSYQILWSMKKLKMIKYEKKKVENS